ncbi:ribonuclease P protein subunit p29 [Anopheles funestus]|uniref:ribonuclease P protein subunit p29 n=1 Tax=Anopheles funestus TaxID=62324 RepID=UPI0020C5E3B2|nr:ribonuclease P protein subunit p29 [Anopheles funestus]
MEGLTFMSNLVQPEKRVTMSFEKKRIVGIDPRKPRKKIRTTPKQKKKLSRKEIKELGLYTLPQDTVKYSDALKLHKIWCGYFDTLFASDEIPTVTDSSYNTVVVSLLKADYHGAKIRIIRSKQSSVVGMKGIVVLDTKGTFKMVSKDNILRTIPKNDSMFEINNQGKMVTIFGKYLTGRPAERSVKKTKSFSLPTL